jgi:hypothetical protein
MSAFVFAILTGFAIFLFERFQLDARWIAYGVIALAGVAAWIIWESLEESDVEDDG